MNYNVDNWPFLWFGPWKEHGPSFSKYPSYENFIDPELNEKYDKEKLVHYLISSPITATTSRLNFTPLFDAKFESASISHRTNGSFVWLDDLAIYVANHNFVIPTSWYAQIEEQNFEIQTVTEEDIEVLESKIRG